MIFSRLATSNLRTQTVVYAPEGLTVILLVGKPEYTPPIGALCQNKHGVGSRISQLCLQSNYLIFFRQC